MSATSTGRCSPSWGCRRRSRAPSSPATRAIRGRCGGCCSTSSATTSRRPAAGSGGAVEPTRADALYERIFLGYGDDSVAQLGGAHIACEWVSNILTKILQRPRPAAYLEQSTRYIAYDAPMVDGAGASRYRYYRDPDMGPEYSVAMDELFGIYAQLIPVVTAWAQAEYPRADGEAEAAHARAIKAKALDLLRGLLPAASLSHMGIYASGQTYEQLILHLLAHPLREARLYGAMLLREVQAVIPSFVTRVQRPDRGGQWISYLESRARAGEHWARRLELDGPAEPAGPVRAPDARRRRRGRSAVRAAVRVDAAAGVESRARPCSP